MAIQKSGRLSDSSLQLIRECGIGFQNGTGKLKAQSHTFPMEFLFLRDDDIPGYVADGIADLGIVGENVVAEKDEKVDLVYKLGFSRCRLSLAIPRNETYQGIKSLQGQRIATSYPKILANYLAQHGVEADIHEISGSVEIAPSIGLAGAICDIVSSGSTLFSNGLEEVEVVMKSEAVLVAHPHLSEGKKKILDDLLFRIRSVHNARDNKYILMNVPNESLAKVIDLLPGMRSPSVLPLAQSGWSSLHSVIHEEEFWSKIDALKAAGAEGILIVPIEKMIL
ncbi:ATP phosphoribosyltransferase [Catalinimonas alkaloidigena]|uniref:ATP phosphoribosyltransferase n=1 Tax=Catalinimonas alkaloidigena TaxID=1075417 RepID=A0A1G9FED2_9BACT|nr:ATP phosphoribosyltransferase [Catalinimonas alkaloidigena]SDK86706.1 ATP phosphoribosyltransferase [Catalinimonas alkaloidigena]